jgi:hypothetical protein
MNLPKNQYELGKMRIAAAVLLALSIGAVLFPIKLGLSQAQSLTPRALPGQSATRLSDGRWLLIGGEGMGGPFSTASILDPQTGITTQVPGRLQLARAWHSATVLPRRNGLYLRWRGCRWSVSPICGTVRS